MRFLFAFALLPLFVAVAPAAEKTLTVPSLPESIALPHLLAWARFGGKDRPPARPTAERRLHRAHLGETGADVGRAATDPTAVRPCHRQTARL